MHLVGIKLCYPPYFDGTRVEEEFIKKMEENVPEPRRIQVMDEVLKGIACNGGEIIIKSFIYGRK